MTVDWDAIKMPPDPWLTGQGESLDDVFSTDSSDSQRTFNDTYHQTQSRPQGEPVTDHPNLATALAAFQAEMPVVAKNKKATVPTKAGGSYSYTYADLADVTAAAMPLLSQHGLSFSACPRGTDHGYELTGVLLHTSGEAREGSLPLHGNSPQELGGSLTYARRYLLGCMTGIVTDDDNDAQSAQTAQRTEKPMTAKTRGQMFALFGQKGIPEESQLAGINSITGANYTSRSALSEADARSVINALKQRPDAAAPVEPEGDAS